MTATRRTRPMPIAAKMAATAAIVAVAETVFHPDSEIGWVIGLLGLVWVMALIVVRPIVLRDPAARIAAVAAAAYALVLVDDPNPLALLLGWIAVSLAALLPRWRFGDALVWGQRLAWHAMVAIGTPWRDAARAAHHRQRGGMRATATLLAIPILGGALFLTLFANANPVIGQAFERIALPDLATVLWRSALAGMMGTAVWATLRPRPMLRGRERRIATRIDPGVAVLVLSLATFNAIFAVQNALDILFLWSGAALPAGVTMADYAHRGAYALIVTALIAALFVLAMLRPGAAAAQSPAVRRLVTAWIVQNLLLVASSALRLCDYVAAYGMTTLRLAALAWMALVATGLALILWRLLRDRSAAWLINANALAATLVLSAASVIDLGATAAAWNSRVALREGRAGPPLDLCYLARLGPSGLVALAQLERHAKGAELQDRLAYLRTQTEREVVAMQSDWRSWSGRNARRLTQVGDLVGDLASVRPKEAPQGRGCDGRINPPEPAAPLTKAPQR